MKDTIRLAIRNNPLTEADKFREQASDKDITNARAFYYPRVNAMALEAKGFPGSAAATGVEGLMVSPFHQGAAAGLLFEQEIFDFGRTSAKVTIAQTRSGLAKAESRVRALQIGSQATNLFVSCVKHRSLTQVYKDVVKEAESVQREVERFVSTGQRSIVDRYLSRSQTEEAVTSAEVYTERLAGDYDQLRALLVDPNIAIGCPPVTERMAKELVPLLESNGTLSPLVVQSKSELNVEQAQVSRSRKDYYPRIVGMASVGFMQGAALGLPIQNYSYAFGLIFPLFEGFKTNSEVEAGLARSMQKEKELSGIKLQITEANLAYDEDIGAARVKMLHLHHEFEIAELAYNVAKKRYTGQQGTLVDVREALRNWTRIQAELTEAQSQLLIKSAQKALLNGPLLDQVTI